ncbi:hypothetical protein Loa_00384 [Legionella oakridgensis ATCC 33761 = DSM 21215]|uniref:Uncharacterized protein n=2 Tax=Legionella oakridgensis TaxID=29423 RepID=W0B610_9GAMM|nr:hypothetical protein Loa_00384 [Legionella oakridgensis ATCC 33761 = DSM 21215]KTD39741.1 hypothetical protein Loak_0887 [Legionella oakridgensis]STY15891.1 Uncharacterised protein [Legionella longbeachae]
MFVYDLWKLRKLDALDDHNEYINEGPFGLHLTNQADLYRIRPPYAYEIISS